MRKSIGIDVASEKLDVAIYDGSKFILEKTFSNNKKGIDQILKLASENPGIHVTMEATGSYHFKIAHALFQLKVEVSVVNPLVIKRFNEMKMLRNKTDRIDARMIALYGSEQKPTLYKPKTQEEELLRNLTETRNSFISTINSNKNRIHALKKSAYEHHSIFEAYEKINQALKNEIKKISKQIKELIHKIYFVESQILDELKGIGPVCKSIIFGHLSGFKNFDNAKQVCAFIGISPSKKESGKSVHGKGKINRKGNPYIRSIFYMLSLSAIRCNPTCKAFYERLLKMGKEKKLALVAVANKLIKILFALVKFKRHFDPNYLNKNFAF